MKIDDVGKGCANGSGERKKGVASRKLGKSSSRSTGAIFSGDVGRVGGRTARKNGGSAS